MSEYHWYQIMKTLNVTWKFEIIRWKIQIQHEIVKIVKIFFTRWQNCEDYVSVVGMEACCEISFWSKPWEYSAVVNEQRRWTYTTESFWYFVSHRFCCSYFTGRFENIIESVAKISKNVGTIEQNIKYFRCSGNHSAKLCSFFDKKLYIWKNMKL